MKQPCPKCRAAGRDHAGDNLVVFPDGAYCFACGYTTSDIQDDTPPRKSMKLAKPIAGGKPVEIQSRKISAQTSNKLGILFKDGKLFFPVYSTSGSGRLLDYKVRPADMSRKFTWHIGGQDLSDGFFFGTSLRGGPNLIITSGETDTASFVEAVPNNKYTVWGLTKGEHTIGPALESVGAELGKFKSITIALDADEVGQASVLEATARLPHYKTFVLHYPPGHKDASDVLMGLGSKALRELVDTAQPLADKAVDTGDAFLDTILSDEDSGVPVSTGWQELDELFGGWLPGHVYALAADTGIGKTSYTLDWALAYAILYDAKVMVASLEMTNRDVAYKLIGSLLGVHTLNARTLRATPGFQEAARFVTDHFVLLKKKGYLETTELTDMVRSARLYNAKFFLLDHLTAAATGPDGLSWAGLDARAQALQAVTVEEGVIVLNVTHISRSERDTGDGTTPPHLSKIRGGNGLAQNSSLVAALYAPDGKDDLGRVVKVLKKHRAEIGKFGEADHYRLDTRKIEELTASATRNPFTSDNAPGQEYSSTVEPRAQATDDVPTGQRPLRDATPAVRSSKELHTRPNPDKQGAGDTDMSTKPSDGTGSDHTSKQPGARRSQRTIHPGRPLKDAQGVGGDRRLVSEHRHAFRRPNKDN